MTDPFGSYVKKCPHQFIIASCDLGGLLILDFRIVKQLSRGDHYMLSSRGQWWRDVQMETWVLPVGIHRFNNPEKWWQMGLGRRLRRAQGCGKITSIFLGYLGDTAGAQIMPFWSTSFHHYTEKRKTIPVRATLCVEFVGLPMSTWVFSWHSGVLSHWKCVHVGEWCACSAPVWRERAWVWVWSGCEWPQDGSPSCPGESCPVALSSQDRVSPPTLNWSRQVGNSLSDLFLWIFLKCM